MSQSTRLNPPDHSVAYPENHVIGIMPTANEAIAAFDGLIADGFQESEVTSSSGLELADRIRAIRGSQYALKDRPHVPLADATKLPGCLDPTTKADTARRPSSRSKAIS
jgi:hypothetical protein